jgi:hypothetical protein
MTTPKDVRPEVALLLRCARSSIVPDNAEEIDALLQTSVDWKYFVDLVLRQGNFTLIYQNLSTHFQSTTPHEVLNELRRYYLSAGRMNLLLSKSLPKIMGALDQEGIRALAFKGPTLAALAYGDLFLRPYNDLDILVDDCDYERAKHLFMVQGCELVADWHYQSTLSWPNSCFSVDLHKDLVHDRFLLRLPFDKWYERRQSVYVSDVNIPSLSIEDTIMMLCIQIAKDGWENNHSLMKICDLAEMLRHYPDVNWDGLLNDARKLGARRIVFIGLELAKSLLDAPIPGRILPKTRNDERVSSITEQLVVDLFSDHNDNKTPQEEHIMHFAMRETWKKLYPFYWRFYSHIFVPNEFDRELIRLPPALAFGYYLIRPARLLGKYGSRAWKALSR